MSKKAKKSGSHESHTASNKVSHKTRTAILLVIVGFLAACAAAFAILNLVAVSSYNSATSTLMKNIKTYSQAAPDLEILAASQEQADAQFEQAASAAWSHIPSVQNSIEKNAAISKRLTKRIAEDQKKTDSSGSAQSSDSSSSGSTSTSGNSSGSSSSSSSSSSDSSSSSSSATSTTTNNQKKLKKLLKHNKTTNPSYSSSSTSSSTSSAKPW